MAEVQGIQINIAAKIDELKKALDEAKKALGSVAQEAEKQSDAISDPLKKAADQIADRYGSIAGTIATRLLGLINPATLAASAVTAIGAALLAYYESMQEKSISAEDALKKHAQLIKELKTAYGDALSGLEKYTQESEAAFRNRIGGSILELEKQIQSLSRTFMNQFGPSIYRVFRDAETGAVSFGDSFFALPKKFEPFRSAIEQLQKSIRDGSPDYVTFRERVSEIGSAAASVNPELNKTAYELAEGARQGFQMQQGINAGREALQQLTPEAKAAHEALNKFNEATKALQAVEPAKIDALTAATNKYNEAINSAGITEEQRVKLRADLDAAEKRSADAKAAIAAEEARIAGEAAAREAQRLKQIEEDEKNHYIRSMENLRTSWGTREEQLAAHLVREQEMINAALQTKAISDETHKAMMERSEDEHQKRLQMVRDRTNMQALRSTAGMFGSLQSLTESFGKKNTAMSKAFGIAQALINTYVGVTQALRTLPPPASYAAAAATLAQGLAQVASIRSISDSGKGGGGGASASSGAGAAAAASGGGGGGGGQGGGNSVYINLQGQSFGRDQVRALVEQIASYQKDGGQVVFA